MTIIAQQAQPVMLDEKGEGTVTLPIGDFNGELRVMAQAWTADDFGSSEGKTIVAAPVIAELNMPRFLASGDTTRLALDLSNLTDKPQTLNVALTASGLLQLEGEKYRRCSWRPARVAPCLYPSARMKVSAMVR